MTRTWERPQDVDRVLLARSRSSLTRPIFEPMATILDLDLNPLETQAMMLVLVPSWTEAFSARPLANPERGHPQGQKSVLVPSLRQLSIPAFHAWPIMAGHQAGVSGKREQCRCPIHVRVHVPCKLLMPNSISSPNFSAPSLCLSLLLLPHCCTLSNFNKQTHLF